LSKPYSIPKHIAVALARPFYNTNKTKKEAKRKHPYQKKLKPNQTLKRGRVPTTVIPKRISTSEGHSRKG